jgi:hypothetical protein
MFWKLHNLTLTILINSIKALSAAAISPYVLQQAAVSTDQFACEAFYCSGIADQFPCLVTGAVPPSVSCFVALSPLMDMRYLHAWRLLIDSLQGNSKAKDDIPYIHLFLARAITCVDSDTNLGVVMSPELTSNFAFHFYMLHGFLTNDTNPFADFMRSEAISQIAQTYKAIPIQVHPDQLAPAADVKLMTASAQSAKKHRQKTPCRSKVPVDLLLPPCGPSGATQPVAKLPLCTHIPFQGTPVGMPDDARLRQPSLVAWSGSRSHHPVKPPSTPSGTNLFGGSTVGVYLPPFQRSLALRGAYVASLALLPIFGLTSLEMKPLATFIISWFRSMEITQGFRDAHFDQFILGCRLRYLISILDRHQVQLLWASNTRTMTYVWFKHLQYQLCLFQRLSIEAMWKLDSGFLPPMPDHPKVCPINQCGQHFIDILQEWDTLLMAQWRPNRLHAAAAFYDAATIPSSHFVQAPTPRIPRNLTPAGATGSLPLCPGTVVRRLNRSSPSLRLSTFL